MVRVILDTFENMQTYSHIERYYAEKQRLIDFGGSDNEQNIRRAFENCLDSYCRDHREGFALVPELPTKSGIIPDGTVRDSLRMARGYWEAKDTHDDLDTEIQKKFNRGYPRNNIIFEDSQTAVLFQNGNEAMRVDMQRTDELHRLIRSFLDYELPEIEEFRQARQQFKTRPARCAGKPAGYTGRGRAGQPRLPVRRRSLPSNCADRASAHPCPRPTCGRCCSSTSSPRDIFLRIFSNVQFHRENNVARQLAALEQTFFTGDVRHQAIDRLRAYYGGHRKSRRRDCQLR